MTATRIEDRLMRVRHRLAALSWALQADSHESREIHPEAFYGPADHHRRRGRGPGSDPARAGCHPGLDTAAGYTAEGRCPMTARRRVASLRLATSNGVRVLGARIPKAPQPVVSIDADNLMYLAEVRPGAARLIGEIIDDTLADIEANEADDDDAS